MRLCDRDIEAWLDEGDSPSIRVRPLSVLMARRLMYGWVINFAPSVATHQPLEGSI